MPFFFLLQESWTKASKKQREKLLELIRRLAEDDKEGLMASKVLELLWNIAHDKNLPNEIIDQALTSHLKILDYSCLQEKEKTKLFWIDKFMDEVKHERGYVIHSLKQLKEICMQFQEVEKIMSSTQFFIDIEFDLFFKRIFLEWPDHRIELPSSIF